MSLSLSFLKLDFNMTFFLTRRNDQMYKVHLFTKSRRHISGLPLHHPTPPAETNSLRSLPGTPQLPRRTDFRYERWDDGAPTRDRLSPGEHTLEASATCSLLRQIMQTHHRHAISLNSRLRETSLWPRRLG